MNNGIESAFCTVIGSKKVAIKKLKDTNSMLNITEEEELLGYKHVFQTKLTKETVNERLRSPIGMWTKDETFINNDVQLVLNRLHTFYN